jgi:4-aminobutyrate aminotransferase/(S)-3-amino-2-methylpropionate transaminase
MNKKSEPEIHLTPPGPESIKLMKLREKYVPNAVAFTVPIFVASSQGATITDVDGNTYIDFATGISCLNIGHRNREVIKEIKTQLEKYLHLSYHVTPYEPYIRLAQKLATIAPGDFEKKVVLVNSGAEAVENAVKVARKYTGKNSIITFEHAFHGRTRLGMSLTGSIHPYKYGFGAQDPGIYRFPYAYCYRCPFGLEQKNCGTKCIEYIEDNLAIHLSPDEVAGMIVEPVQGEGGFIVPPTEFMTGLNKICNEKAILLVADEVQSGLGRTGEMFATEHFGIVPDVIALAKSLGGGLPLGATVARADIMDSVQVGGLGGTFGGNPLSCVAGLKTITIIQSLLENTKKLSSILKYRLNEISEGSEIVGDVRGLGLMFGVELVKDRKTKEPAAKERNAVLQECFRKGLVIMGAGAYKNVIRFLPPLNIDEPSLNKGLDTFEDALLMVSKQAQ